MIKTSLIFLCLFNSLISCLNANEEYKRGGDCKPNGL